MIGIEADVGVSPEITTRGSSHFTAHAIYERGFFADLTDNFSGEISRGWWDASLRARAGFLVTPWVLIYGTAGFALADEEGGVTRSAVLVYCRVIIVPGVCAPGGTETQTGFASGHWAVAQPGLTGGGGMEFAVSRRIKARFEYRFTDLGRFSRDLPITRADLGCPAAFPGCTLIPLTGPPTLHVTESASFQTFRVGVSYSLGEFGPSLW